LLFAAVNWFFLLSTGRSGEELVRQPPVGPKLWLYKDECESGTA
jgi:hypothetical protein